MINSRTYLPVFASFAVLLVLFSSGCVKESRGGDDEEQVPTIVTKSVTLSLSGSYEAASGGVFDPGEPMVHLVHEAGDYIDWSVMEDLYCVIAGMDMTRSLYVMSINGISTNNASKTSVSGVGDHILLSLRAKSVDAGSTIVVHLMGETWNWTSEEFEVGLPAKTALGVSARDAAATASVGTDPKTWSTGEDFVALEHLTGSAINWSGLIDGITVHRVGSETEYQLTISTILGQKYSDSNCVTTPGDIIILRFKTATTAIRAGDAVVVTIEGNTQAFQSPKDGFVVY